MESMPGDDVTVLHVDDEPAMLDVSAEMLERELSRLSVETASSPVDALDRLQSSPRVDCVVSDYQMPSLDGLELLAAVQDRRPDLPFILFTGKGSEEIASEAISAGVTDYIQKEPGSDQFTVLANRIENAVAQHRAQAAVETTKQRYRTLIRESSDVIVVAEPDGTIRYVSPAVDRVLRYTEDALVGEHVFEHVHPEDRATAEAVLEGTLAESPSERTAEFRFQRGDDTWTRLEAEGRNLLDDEVVGGVVIYARDVAERAAREDELERYEQIVEVAGDGAYVLDGTGHYEMVNEKTVERTGYSAEELVGQHGSLVFDDEDIDRSKAALLDVVRDDDTDFAQFEATVHARDGTAYPVEIRTAPIVDDGRIVGAVGISRDIAERKARERELERYEKIVETAGDAAHVIDDEGRYVMVNDVLVERTGYDRDELVGSHVRTLIDEDDYERGSAAIQEVLGSGTTEFAELEISIETKSGDTYPAEVRMAPIVEDGDVRGSVGIVREITERKRRERELERQNERLGKFATVVSHDLRNPLNVALARTELAQEDPDGDHLVAAGDALRRMERLIDDLLELAREGRTVEDPEPVAIETIAGEAWASVATPGANLTVADDVTVEGDRSRLRQVFENLFRNAVEHGSTSPGSPLGDASTEANEPSVAVTVGGLPEGGFYVEDDGPGLGEVDRPTIFETDYSTKQDGVGLGLSIVRDVVEAHGWEIRVADSTAGGARFEIRVGHSGAETSGR